MAVAMPSPANDFPEKNVKACMFGVYVEPLLVFGVIQKSLHPDAAQVCCRLMVGTPTPSLVHVIIQRILSLLPYV